MNSLSRRIGIIQSCYIPWRGYLDFINSVDLFVYYDDLYYTPRNWRNRNIVKTANGPQWLSVPVIHESRQQLILETKIDYSQNWQKKHLTTLKTSYGRTPYFEEYFEEFSKLLNYRYENLSIMNRTITQWIMRHLGINTPTITSESLSCAGNKTDRLIDILSKVDGTIYLSGPAAKEYIELDKFISHGIGLEYKTYQYEPYDQIWGDFMSTVTVLDLFFHKGPESKSFIKCQTPNECILESKTMAAQDMIQNRVHLEASRL